MQNCVCMIIRSSLHNEAKDGRDFLIRDNWKVQKVKKTTFYPGKLFPSLEKYLYLLNLLLQYNEASEAASYTKKNDFFAKSGGTVVTTPRRDKQNARALPTYS